MSKTFPLANSLSAEFETGIGFKQDGLKKNWSISGSTNAATTIVTNVPSYSQI